jgi:hypothetical protein
MQRTDSQQPRTKAKAKAKPPSQEKKKKGGRVAGAKRKKKSGRLTDRGYLIFCRALCLANKRMSVTAMGRVHECFTKWVFHARNDAGAGAHAMSVGEATRLQAQRTKTLSAFDEHETFRSEYEREEKLYMSKINAIKKEGAAKSLAMYSNLRYLNSLRRGFDAMLLYAENHEEVDAIRRERDVSMVAFEKISDKMKYIKDVEETNSRLQLSLLVKLSVLRLRSHSTIQSMSATRERNRNIRSSIHDEITKIKEAMQANEDMEKQLVATALAHQDDYFNRLDRAKDQVGAALSMQTELKAMFDGNIQRQMQIEEEENLKSQEATGLSPPRDRSSSSSRRESVN